MVTVISIFSQQTPSVKKVYLQKSKNQSKIAKIIIISGAATSLIGFTFPNGPRTGYVVYYGLSGFTYKNDVLKAKLILSGLGVMLSSIPFFIVSSKNKRKALSASTFLKLERMPVIQQTNFAYQAYPAISVKIGL